MHHQQSCSCNNAVRVKSQSGWQKESFAVNVIQLGNNSFTQFHRCCWPQSRLGHKTSFHQPDAGESRLSLAAHCVARCARPVNINAALEIPPTLQLSKPPSRLNLWRLCSPLRRGRKGNNLKAIAALVPVRVSTAAARMEAIYSLSRPSTWREPLSAVTLENVMVLSSQWITSSRTLAEPVVGRPDNNLNPVMDNAA